MKCDQRTDQPDAMHEPGVDILREEDPFGKGIFGVLQGRISGFLKENSKISIFHEKHLIYFAICTLKLVVYCKNHENTL